MEEPEFPHNGVADQVLEVPKPSNFDQGLLKVCETLEDLHLLKPLGLDHVSLESVLRDPVADINEEGVRQHLN